ncbi:hypothetical protein MED222_05170 [Vibrio sp. MED222]|nr:hypothetical protein MED222_05170 [Vibrio sp. MED222]
MFHQQKARHTQTLKNGSSVKH